MRRAVMIGVMWLWTALPAQAQSPPPVFNSTAAAVVGGGRTWDDEGVIGDGALVGGRVDWRLGGRTFVEGAVERLHHERTGRFTADGHTTFVTAALVQRFGGGAAQPYALGGGTIAHHSGTFGFLGDSKVSLAESTDVGVVFGGGLAVRVARRFEIGPEIRFFLLRPDDDSSPAFVYWIGARVGVRF